MSLDPAVQKAIDRVNFINSYAGAGRFEEDEQHIQRDPKSGRIAKSRDYGSDLELNITFSLEERINQGKSADANMPVYDEIEFITILCPGNRLNTYHGPVTDFYMWRFPKEYDSFKAGNGDIVDGTPLREWPLMSKGQIRDLNYNGVYTVEQVASLSDSSSGILRGFYSMKLKAQAFLAVRMGVEKTDELNAQLAERDARLAKLEAQLEALLAPKVEASKAEPEKATVKVKT